MKLSLDDCMIVATKAAREAGSYALKVQHNGLTQYAKGFRDWVTDADLTAQELIIETIRGSFPDHAFLAEEGSVAKDWLQATTHRPTWIIDPIDGTSNYSRRISNFAISIALAYQGEARLGVVYDPVHDELFTAISGQGSYCNGRPLAVGKRAGGLAEAIIALDWGRSRAQRQQIMLALGLLVHCVRTLRVIGSAALALCWIADQRLEAYINYNLKIWDVAAAGLILQEAGGTTCGHDALAWRLIDQSSWIISFGGLAKNELLARLNSQPE